MSRYSKRKLRSKIKKNRLNIERERDKINVQIIFS